MPKKPKTKLPFKAKTMGSYQRQVLLSTLRKETKTAAQQTSTVTVFKPDAEGNLVATETVAPVPAKPVPKKKRAKIPKAERSLL